MVQTILKDILTVDRGVIAHQVNCLGVMGGGVALGIRRKYPSVYGIYLDKVQEAPNKQKLLGDVLIVKAEILNDDSELYVCNMFAQFGVGRDKVKTQYNELRKCLIRLKKVMMLMDWREVYVPYKIGCGLGGGDWNIVYPMLMEVFNDNKINCFICKLPE